MSLAAASTFCYRFGTGLKAGADLMKLLHAEAGHGSSRQREAMRGLAERAKQGELLSVAMDRQKPFFPPLLGAMTRVGEATGRLDRALLSLHDHYSHRLTLRRAFLTSLAWPALQLVAAIGVLSLLIWLLGNLTPAGGGEMTDVLGLGLRGGGDVLKLWAFVALFCAMVYGMIWAFFRNVGGVQNLIPLMYLIPVIGPAIQTITLSRFCWTLSLALDSGLDPIRSIELALDSTDSQYYRATAKDAEAAILGGASLAGGLRATDLFPDDFLTRVEISELSGTDAESIDMLAKEYDERARMAVRTMSGVATGLIWLSVMLLLIFLILKIAMNVFGGYSDALAPI